MQLPENIYLIRHGQYFEHGFGQLTELGKEQAAKSGEKLKAEGFNSDSMLMSSTALRCINSAMIIANILDLQSEMVFSNKIKAMDADDCFRDVREVIAEAAEESGIDIDPDRPLAVVGHAPMIYKELAVDLNELGDGSVHRMQT